MPVTILVTCIGNASGKKDFDFIFNFLASIKKQLNVLPPTIVSAKLSPHHLKIAKEYHDGIRINERVTIMDIWFD
jgi:hypothetical protein